MGTIYDPFSAHRYLDFQGELSHVTLARGAVINTLREAKLRDPEFRELEHAFLVVLRHEPNATPQERILEYLSAEQGRTITNRIARELTGIGSENAVKRIFTKLKEAGRIHVVDESAGKQLTAYRLTARAQPARAIKLTRKRSKTSKRRKRAQ